MPTNAPSARRPPAWPPTSVLIQGVDAAGATLWVTAIEDPRHTHFEDFSGPDGPRRYEHVQDNSALSAGLDIPLTPALARLRSVRRPVDGPPVFIGESEWRPETNDGSQVAAQVGRWGHPPQATFA